MDPSSVVPEFAVALDPSSGATARIQSDENGKLGENEEVNENRGLDENGEWEIGRVFVDG